MSECKYCKKESYGRPFCDECGLKYFGFKAPTKQTNIKISKHVKCESHNYEKHNCGFRNHETTTDNYDDYSTKSKKYDGYNLSDFENWKRNDCDTKYYKSIKKRKNNIFSLFSFKKETLKNNQNKTLCARCGQYSNGYKYCYNCYKQNKLKNDEVKYKCQNGIYVRSKSEMIISDILTYHNIIHQYEKEITVTIKDEYGNINDVTIKPDFYIPKLKINNRVIKEVYIEHFGLLDKEDYRNKTLAKLMIYEQLKTTLICTEEKDMLDAHESILKKLKEVKENEINY